jgi:hypothetical protein
MATHPGQRGNELMAPLGNVGQAPDGESRAADADTEWKSEQFSGHCALLPGGAVDNASRAAATKIA